MTSQATSQVTHEVIEHDGFTTSVSKTGTSDLPAMLLIHGSGPGATGWSNWQYLLPEIGDRYHAVAVNLSGYGKSPAPEPQPDGTRAWLDVWVRQVLSLVDHLGLKDVHLVGNSLGGAIALHLVLRRPDLFSKVVLMGPAGAPFEITRELDMIWGFYDEPSRHLMKSAISWFAYDPDFLGDQLESIAEMRFEAAMRPEIRAAFASMFPRPRQASVDALVVPVADLRRVRQPVLLVHGVDDFIVPLATSDHLLRHLGGPVQAHYYKRCSHWTQVEFKASFNRLIDEFFTGRV